MEDTSPTASGESQEKPQAKEQDRPEHPQHIPLFLEYVRRSKPFETLRPFVRVTPGGLFVEESKLEAVLEIFKVWLEQYSQGEDRRTGEKLKRKFFSNTEPVLRYLVEGKICMRGVLAPAKVQEPQKYALPYFLGSLIEGSQYLHPGDPLVSDLRNGEVALGPQGPELRITSSKRPIAVSTEMLKRFAQIAQRSHRLVKRYPELETTLAGAVKPLLFLFGRARLLKSDWVHLVPISARGWREKDGKRGEGRRGKGGGDRRGAPQPAKDDRPFSGLFVQDFYMFVVERDRLTAIHELVGRNFSTFVRDEFMRVDRRKLGSFHLFERPGPNIGTFSVRGQNTALSPRAFSEFIQFLGRATDKREKLEGWFTVEEAFQRFSSFFQLATPIERKKLEHTLKEHELGAGQLRVYGGWTFLIGPEGAIDRCVARHLPRHAPRTRDGAVREGRRGRERARGKGGRDRGSRPSSDARGANAGDAKSAGGPPLPINAQTRSSE